VLATPGGVRGELRMSPMTNISKCAVINHRDRLSLGDGMIGTYQCVPWRGKSRNRSVGVVAVALGVSLITACGSSGKARTTADANTSDVQSSVASGPDCSTFPAGPTPQPTEISGYLIFASQSDYASIMCGMQQLSDASASLGSKCQAAEPAGLSAQRVYEAGVASGYPNSNWETFLSAVMQAGLDCQGGFSSGVNDEVRVAVTAWQQIRQALAALGYTNLPALTE
jgi:hypothetical protein